MVAVAWLLFALSWGALHGWIVPRVGEWRPALERLATQALGVRVTLGEVRAESRGPIPALEFRDVRLHDAQGREALHLSRVLAALSAQSLWRLGFEQLLIENPVLDVRRTEEFAAGHVPGARNVPHERLIADPAALATPKDTEIVVYCQSGRRAGLAIEALRKAGYTRVSHLEGDFPGWASQGRPVETPAP